MADEKEKDKIKEIVKTWICARLVLNEESGYITMSENEIIYCLNRVVEDINKWKMSDKISNEKNDRMSRFDKQKVQEPNISLIERPTDKQIDFMRKHDVAYTEKTTKKEASELIEKEIASWK